MLYRDDAAAARARLVALRQEVEELRQTPELCAAEREEAPLRTRIAERAAYLPTIGNELALVRPIFWWLAFLVPTVTTALVVLRVLLRH